MVKTAIVLTAALALAAPGVARAAANLVQNGNFQTTTTTSSNGNFELDVNSDYGTVSNWYVTNSTTSTNPYNVLFTTGAGSNVSQTSTTAGSPSNPTANAYGQYSSSGKEYLAAGYTGSSPNGGNFMALDGDTSVNGNLSQNITGLTNGTLYELDFYWAVSQMASRSGNVSDSLQVTLGSATQSTATVSITSGGFSGWMKQTIYFTATSANEVLSFLSIGAPAGLPPLALLDGVSLTAAPEPSTIALLVAGVGGLAVIRRRSKPKAAFAA